MALPDLAKLAEDTQAARHENDPTAFLLAEHAWLRTVLDALKPRIRMRDEQSSLQSDIAELQSMLVKAGVLKKVPRDCSYSR